MNSKNWLQLIVLLIVLYELSAQKSDTLKMVDMLKEIRLKQKDFQMKVKLLKDTAHIYNQYLKYYLSRTYPSELDKRNSKLEFAFVQRIAEYSLKMSQSIEDIRMANFFLRKVLKHHHLSDQNSQNKKLNNPASKKIMPFKWG